MKRSALLSIILSVASLAGHAQVTYAEEQSEIARLRGRVKQVTERSYHSESNTDSLPHLKHKPFGKDIYLLDTSGRLIRWTSDIGRYGTEVYQYRYRGDTVIRTLYNNKRFQRRLITVQNREGQGSGRQVRYFVEDDRGVLPLAIVNDNDDRNNPVTEHHRVPEGAMRYADMHYRYLYDREGNWIQKTVAFESGEIKEVTTRTIVYWP